MKKSPNGTDDNSEVNLSNSLVQDNPHKNEKSSILRDRVLSLLSEAELAAYNKEKIRLFDYLSGGILFIPDLYLPIGCEKLNLLGPSCIEFKRELTFSTALIYRGVAEDLSCRKDFINGKLVIIYEKTSLSKNDKHELFNKYFLAISLDELSQWGEKLNWLKINTKTERARNAFRYGNVVLFLGAGVSMSAGLPSWEQLLKNVLKNCKGFSENDFDFISKQCFNSSIIAARYIKLLHQKYNDGKKSELKRKFLTLLHSSLYSKLKRKIGKDVNKEISPLLTAIGEMVLSKKVISIVTYNYDDLIEQELTRRNIRCLTVKGRNAPNKGEFPIYHVHGTLVSNKGYLKESDVVLSEDEYHSVYMETFSWSTVEQLHALRNSTCIFIGLSMSDPNLRRLLDFAWDKQNNDENRHFVLLQNTTKSKFNTKENMQMQEKMMQNFGIDVIWYDHFDQLPDLLRHTFLQDDLKEEV